MLSCRFLCFCRVALFSNVLFWVSRFLKFFGFKKFLRYFVEILTENLNPSLRGSKTSVDNGDGTLLDQEGKILKTDKNNNYQSKSIFHGVKKQVVQKCAIPVVKRLTKSIFITKLLDLILPQFPRSHMYSILPPELFRLWELTCFW